MNHDPLSEDDRTNDDEGAKAARAAEVAKAARRAQRRRGRWLRAAVWPLVALAALAALALGMLFALIQTESGTRYAWRTAVELLGGHLSGTLDGGALSTGVRLTNLRWHDEGIDIRIDHIEGKWRLRRVPLKFKIDFLHAQTVDVRVAPSTTPATKATLPKDLRLPLQIEIGDVRVAKVLIHEGTSTTELSRLALHGRSDGRHHEVSLDRLTTPFGDVNVALALDGVRPFALSGDAGFTGKISDEAVQVGARVSGSLEQLNADVDATGMKLTGHAQAVAMPFGDVPLKTLTLHFEHVDPRAFSPGAPQADLLVQAEVHPVPAPQGGSALRVAGTASIVNAIPGRLDEGKVPLIDAQANVRLDEREQAIDKLQLRVLKDATVTGSGQLKDGLGQFDLKIANFDLRTLTPAVRTTRVSGPVRIVLRKGSQHIDAQLADPVLALRAQAAVNLTPAQTQIESLKLQLGKGRVDASGVLKNDLASGFSVKGTLTDFNPFPLLAADSAAQPAPRAAARPRAQAGAAKTAVAGASATAGATTAAEATATAKASRAAGPNPPKAPASTRAPNALNMLHATNAAEGASAVDAANTAHAADSASAASSAAAAASASASASASAHAQAAKAPQAAAPASATTHAGPSSQPSSHPNDNSAAAGRDPRDVRITGTLSADGTLAPQISVKARFALRDAVYAGLPMTGEGMIQMVGSRLLPSSVQLSVAGNQVDAKGSFGTPRDRLLVHVDAPALDRLGFGVGGVLKLDGDLTGTLAHPNAIASYEADHVVFGDNRVGHAQGRAELRDGAQGAMTFSLDAKEVAVPGVDLATVSAHLSGTRAAHQFDASATGKLEGRPIDVTLAGRGALNETRGSTAWSGTVAKLENRGAVAIALRAPVQIAVADQKISVGSAQLSVDAAVLALQRFEFDHGKISSAGSLTNVGLARSLALEAQWTGAPPSTLKTDLVFDGAWDFTLSNTASGYAQIKRRSGDLQVDAGRGLVLLGLKRLEARVDLENGNRAHLSAVVDAGRVGTANVDLSTGLVARDGMLTISTEAPVSGKIVADVPVLKTTGELLGPAYIIGGRAALQLTVGGLLGRPKLSGTLTGDDLAATMVDQGVTLKNGIVRIELDENRVELRQVEFHGADGLLKATGEIQLDRDDPEISAQIVADKLQLFASPERQLSLSGSAELKHSGPAGGLAINGKFTVDHALFDMPESAAPSLGDDVKIVRSDGELVKADIPAGVPGHESAGRFAPRANVAIDLGRDFRFKGSGADLSLRGTLNVISAPNEPLHGEGNIRVEPGSTYEAFGRKLDIENGYFTFNGPIDNPGINILAMRRNQEYEAGVQVTGTLRSPNAKLISVPDLPDSEKLSWLLFGHGTDTGNNLGQQSTVSTALALLGGAGGKRIAQTFGLDEFSIGPSENGLTDPQVVQIAKAINERFTFGYEQGLQTAQNLFKVTWTVSRNWSLAIHSGTLNGIDVTFNRRFD
jgi:translocation and assembly module TamB